MAACVEFVEGTSSGAVEMVPLSSLEFDVPFPIVDDVPVPSDSRLVAAVPTTDPVGWEIELATNAAVESLDGHYLSAFQRCGEAGRTAIGDTVSWYGSDPGSPRLIIAIDNGVLLVVLEG